MANANDLPLLELWYQALHDPGRIGIRVPCNDPDRMKTALYKARKDAADPQLGALMLQTSPLNPDGEVLITHRIIEDKDVQG